MLLPRSNMMLRKASQLSLGRVIAGEVPSGLGDLAQLAMQALDGTGGVDQLMRSWAMGRKVWLFAGSELAGQRAAMVMSLVQSARLYGHEPRAYLRDVLERLLEHPNHRIDELLPHRWKPAV